MLTIFTVGYEGLDPQKFFGLLERCGVELLIDVRDLPVSRKPGFSKQALNGLCERHEIEYRHVVELGCPRDVRHAYRADGDWANYSVRFKAYLARQAAALSTVAELAQRRRICLLCFEENYNFCHRTYVAEALAPLIQEDVTISHLTGPIKGRVVVRSEALAA